MRVAERAADEEARVEGLIRAVGIARKAVDVRAHRGTERKLFLLQRARRPEALRRRLDQRTLLRQGRARLRCRIGFRRRDFAGRGARKIDVLGFDHHQPPVRHRRLGIGLRRLCEILTRLTDVEGVEPDETRIEPALCVCGEGRDRAVRGGGLAGVEGQERECADEGQRSAREERKHRAALRVQYGHGIPMASARRRSSASIAARSPGSIWSWPSKCKSP